MKHGLIGSRDYTVQWYSFNNETEEKRPLDGQTSLAIPPVAPGAYVAAEIHGGDPEKTVTVYVRRRSDELQIVGVDRSW